MCVIRKLGNDEEKGETMKLIAKLIDKSIESSDRSTQSIQALGYLEATGWR